MSDRNICEAGDIVDLIFVMPHNTLWACGLTRQAASDIMGSWYAAREMVLKKEEGWEEFAAWLEQGTFAYNIENKKELMLHSKPEDERNWCNWTVAWKHVLGMYIKEVTKSLEREGLELHLEIMRRQLRDLKSGEKWKLKGEEEDNAD